jgi:elongator complex protein 2
LCYNTGAPAPEAEYKVSFTQLIPTAINQPPFEQYLIQHTLWPEVNKLYGHGFEMISIAASRDGKLIASGSKASKAEHAVVRLWSTSTWKEVCQPLASHSLTVTSIQFSHNDKWLLTVGRDRLWSLFEKTEGK